MPRRMLPTEAGKRLYNRVVVAIETLESASRPIDFADSLVIRLGAPADFFSEFVLSRFPPSANSRAEPLWSSRELD